MNKTVLLVGGGLLAAYYGYKQVQTFSNNIKFKIKTFKLDKHLTKKKFYTRLYFQVGINILNPSAIGVTLTSLKADLYVNEVLISNINKIEHLTINKNSNTTAYFSLSFQTVKIFKILSEAIKFITLKKSIEVALKGKAIFLKGTLNINEKQKFSL